MKFEEIKKGMLISFGEQLYKVDRYLSKGSFLDERWEMVRVDMSMKIVVARENGMVGLLSVFDIDAMVADQ